MELGTVGVWTTALDLQPSAVARRGALDLERLGYGAIWVGEAVRREPFANAALLLCTTERIVLATGIANIWARDAQAMAAGQLTLAEAFDDRFLLGIGVSHQPLVDGRGHRYGRPLEAMAAYLDAMDAARFDAPRPPTRPPRVLAALGPRMLELAAARADGAHPYLVPVEHSEFARSVLGDGPLLCPEQAVVLESDPARARAIARRHLGAYLRLPNYVRNLRRLGFSEEDVTGDGSDRLVDAVVAWGHEEHVASRVRDHLEAGADHVAVQLLADDPTALPSEGWATLARALRLTPRS
ncbi:MAG TPA: TIGR03620 family F420-dependent LLM class oxidoreductase [Acidimicrobiales bacterium]|nr:TIGR03620 family F420-dependent LLM class oxidoreductase [Acidimicrobiales bacterium]